MRINIISLVILGCILLGCTGTRKFLWLPEKSETAQAVDESSLVTLDSEVQIYLTPEERFEEALLCYDEALDSTAVHNNVAAQNLYESAIVNLSDIEADSLDLLLEDLDWLRGQVISDYAHFLNQLPFLPAESSPSAVYLALSEFLGDSVGSWEDLIDIVLAPEIAGAALDTSAAQGGYPDIPLIVNSYVEEASLFFQTKGRKVFSKWLERGEEAIPYFSDLLAEEGMPEELVYLAMIESGFSNSAYSRAHASGPWQFIASTAKIYGLQVDKYYDQRRDPEHSTRAACRYLRKLYDQFGDWYLAFAAYNCGELRVEKLVKRTGVYDYWQIRESLPRQTRDYVPYYLAARLISQDPEKYGFTKPTFRTPEEPNVVYVDGRVDLKVVAQCAGADYEVVKALNPALKKGCTPPNAKDFPIRLPGVIAANFHESLAKIPRPQRYEKEERSDWVRHRVRSGETLASIAHKYGVSVKSITSIPANKVRNANQIRAGRYLLIPVREEYVASTEEPRVGQPQPPEVTTQEGLVRTIYKVRHGDTLGRIAGKYQVQPSDIKTWNHLWGERFIYPGQKLILWTKSHAEQAGAANLADAENNTDSSPAANLETYVVQPGDTLWDISKRYGISVQDLKKWNGIRSAHRLQPGSQLKLTP